MPSEPWAARHGLRRLLPDRLGMQLALILILGLIAAQLLTGTIWQDVRRHLSMEVPVRVVAERLVQLESLARQGRLDAGLASALQTRDFQFQLRQTPLDAPVSTSKLAGDAQRLLRNVMQHLGVELSAVDVLEVRQQASVHGKDASAGLDGLLKEAAMPETAIRLQAQLQAGLWVLVDAHSQQGWHSESQMAVFWDYFLRIYLLRILLLLGIVLLAVRLVVRPINRLAAAAQALGSNPRQAPLPLSGPIEVRRASAAFNTMQAQIEAHVAERTRFLAAVSHDLRSPMTRLRLRTEMLPESPLREKFREDLTQMEALVNVTLDFVKGGRVDEALSRVDLDSLLSSLASDMAEMGHDVRILGSAGRALPGYPRSLKRCFQNLVENAVRYGGLAEITLQSMPDSIVVTIRDSGPGIPPALLERVLEPYFRAEPSRNLHTGGYGLGLSIAQAVIQSHGGQLTLQNRAQGGLEVIVRLPRS